MGKLMIAVPTVGHIHYKFAESLIGLIRRIEDVTAYDYDVVFEGGTLAYIARNNLVKKAIDGGYDRVLWLDDDMVFDPDIYEVLRDTDKSFVCAPYLGRHAENKPCLFESLRPVKRYQSADDFPKELFRVKGCGFGCVLIETDILKGIRDRYGNCFTPDDAFGEDLLFCDRCDRAGVQIWCEPSAKVGHIGQFILWPNGIGKAL